MASTRVKRWQAQQQERQRNCEHSFDRPEFAGILGLRTYCRCGEMFVPHEHSEGDGCMSHPPQNGWDVVDLSTTL